MHLQLRAAALLKTDDADEANEFLFNVGKKKVPELKPEFNDEHLHPVLSTRVLS